jgi:hypothetical protein
MALVVKDKVIDTVAVSRIIDSLLRRVATGKEFGGSTRFRSGRPGNGPGNDSWKRRIALGDRRVRLNLTTGVGTGPDWNWTSGPVTTYTLGGRARSGHGAIEVVFPVHAGGMVGIGAGPCCRHAGQRCKLMLWAN